MNRFLGRLPKVENSKVPLLRTMLAKANLPVLSTPASTNWRDKVAAWPMLGNDTCGNCVIAGCLHYYQAITANANTEVIPDVGDAVADYTVVGKATQGVGYDPVTHANDNGLVIDYALTYWMQTGLAIAASGSNTELAGMARIDITDREMIEHAISEFCGILVGVNLPIEAQAEVNADQPWKDLTGTPGTWGGHCIYIVDYDEDWLYAVTWGKIQLISRAWFEKYAEEAVALLSADWIDSHTGLSPSHMTLAALDEQIIEMRGVLGVTSNEHGQSN